MTACAPAAVNWTYSGPERPLLFQISPGENVSFSVDATAQKYTLSTVQLTPGEYTMSVSRSSDPEYDRPHVQFFVFGTDTSCLPLAKRSEPAETATSSSTNGALVGGIAVGVGGAVTLLAVGFYFRFAVMRLFRRWGSNSGGADPEVPNHDSQWGIHHSRNISDVSHSHDSQHRLLYSESVIGTPEMRTRALPSSQVTVPRLEPNRRPPSTTLEVGTAPLRIVKRPLPRLEPNRRKPSIATTAALDLPTLSDEPEPSASPPPGVVSAPKVDLEAEFKPICRPPPIAVAPLLKVPKPPRRSLVRHSGISGITSASTALSDMPLLHAGPHGPISVEFPVELQRSHALAKLDAIMDHPPLPTSTPPPPSRSPSPSQSSLETAGPLAEAPQATGARSPIAPIPRSPLSPFLQRMSMQPLSRSGSGRSRYTVRKPVPPIDPSATPAPSDVGSSIMWAQRSSYGSMYGPSSPVPSSSTSQMYRTRDSVWSASLTGSDWTWTRPMQDWEKEQMRRTLAVANPDPDDAETTRSRAASLVGVGNGNSGPRTSVVRHQSFGDMKAMNTVVPDVPPMPPRQRTQ